MYPDLDKSRSDVSPFVFLRHYGTRRSVKVQDCSASVGTMRLLCRAHHERESRGSSATPPHSLELVADTASLVIRVPNYVYLDRQVLGLET